MSTAWILALIAQLPTGVLAEEAKLTPVGGVAGDAFGISVSLSQESVLVGASEANAQGFCSGAAFVFLRTGAGWSPQAKLVPATLSGGDFFGFSVSLWGDTALIGAYQDDDKGQDAGAAYVFVRNGPSWVESAKLHASDGTAVDSFGFSVALHGDTALIGAPRDDDKGIESGSAYMFMRTGTTWTQWAKLTANDGASGDLFGTSVALTENRAVIGAQGDDEPQADSGAAFVFERSGTSWNEIAKLTASDGSVGDTFGQSVAILGGTALVGAPGASAPAPVSGAAYVFRDAGGWTQEAKLFASDGASSDRFGISVSLSTDSALVGAPGVGAGPGKAYLFDRSSGAWIEEEILMPSDGQSGDHFGIAVSRFGLRACVGAALDDDNGMNSGSAYVFRVPTEPVIYCTAKSALVCGPAAIGWSGTASASATSGFLVSASPARSNKAGLLLYSPSGRANIPFPQGGHILCLSTSPIQRAGPTNSGGTPGPAFCDGVLSIDMNAFAHGLWISPTGQASTVPAAFLLQSGSQVNCQYWGRDSTSTGSLLSDAMEYLIGT